MPLAVTTSIIYKITWGVENTRRKDEGKRKTCVLRYHNPNNVMIWGFILMNPHKILSVLVTHIFYTRKVRHKEINLFAQDCAANKTQSRSPRLAPSQCSLHSHFLPRSLCSHASLQTRRHLSKLGKTWLWHRTAVPFHERHQMAQCEAKILLLFKRALG